MIFQKDDKNIRIAVFIYKRPISLDDLCKTIFSQGIELDIPLTVVIFDLTGDSAALATVNRLKTIFGEKICYRNVSSSKNIPFLKNIFLLEKHSGYTIFLDQNCIPSALWLRSFYTLMRERDLLVAYGPVDIKNKPSYFPYSSMTEHGMPDCRDNYIINNYFFHLSSLRFNCDTGLYGRDTPIFFRDVRSAGKSAGFSPDAVVLESLHNDIDLLFIRRRWYDQGSYRNVIKEHSLLAYIYAGLSLIVSFVCLPLFFLLSKRLFFYCLSIFYHSFGFFGVAFGAWGDFYLCEMLNVGISGSSNPHGSNIIMDEKNILHQPIPHICVCIATYRRPDLLNDLLSGLLLQQTGDIFTYSVIVVDNDKELTAKPVVDSFINNSKVTVQYFNEPVKNIALARNKAVENAKGEYVAFIDDDERPDRDWLLNLLTMSVSANADIVGGPVIPLWDVTRLSPLTRDLCQFNYPRRNNGDSSPIFFSTNNALVRMAIIKLYRRPFDNYFGLTGGEDTAFFMNAKSSNAVFSWCESAIVYEHFHAERYKLAWILRRCYRHGNCTARLFLFNKKPITYIYLLPIKVCYSLLCVFVFFMCSLVSLCLFRANSPICILRLFHNAGYFTGLLGIRFYEYK